MEKSASVLISFCDYLEQKPIISVQESADFLSVSYDGIDYYLTLMEIIQRRNLHIHKKGIVDEKYFTKGNGSGLGISVGDYAGLDTSK